MVAVTGLFVILFFVYPGPLVEAAGVAAKSLFFDAYSDEVGPTPLPATPRA